MNKIRSYFIIASIILSTLFIIYYGIFSLFSSVQVFLLSLIALLPLYIMGVLTLKSDKKFSITKGGLVWRLKQNTRNKVIAIIFLSILQLSILAFAFSPSGPQYKRAILFALIIPWLLTSSLLMKEKAD